MWLASYGENKNELDLIDTVDSIEICKYHKSLEETVKVPALPVKEVIVRLNAVDPQSLIKLSNHIMTHPNDYELNDHSWECIVPDPNTGVIGNIDIERSYKIVIEKFDSAIVDFFKRGIDLKKLPVSVFDKKTQTVKEAHVKLTTTFINTIPMMFWKFKETIAGVEQVFIARFQANEEAIP